MDTEKRDEELINSIYETLSSEPSAIRKLDVIIRDTDLKLQPVVERLKELNESDQVDQYEIVRLEKEKERIRKEKQFNRQVEMNAEVKKLQIMLEEMKGR